MNQNGNIQIIVSIRCLVYNHGPYLRDCLDGFVMQKTKFRFEAIVHDDASTDESTTIIREYAEKYPEIIKPIFEEKNCYTSNWDIAENKIRAAYKGKYIAYCEGDDYWVDTYKLQKQVDILEQHPEVMLVHTDYHTVDINSNRIIRPDYEFGKTKVRSGQVFHNLIRHNFVLTASVCIRREVLFSKQLQECPVRLDYSNNLSAASMGDLQFMPEITANYRLAPNSLTQTKNIWVEQQAAMIYEYYVELFLKDKLKKFSWWDKQKTYYSIMAREIEVMRGRRIGHESVVKKHPWLWMYAIFYLFEILLGKINIQSKS